MDDATSVAERRRLFESDALTSTSIFVGRAGTLLSSIAERALPEVLEALEPLPDAFDRPRSRCCVRRSTSACREASLTALERAPELAVLALPDVVWRAPERSEELLLASK